MTRDLPQAAVSGDVGDTEASAETISEAEFRHVWGRSPSISAVPRMCYISALCFPSRIGQGAFCKVRNAHGKGGPGQAEWRAAACSCVVEVSSCKAAFLEVRGSKEPPVRSELLLMFFLENFGSLQGLGRHGHLDCAGGSR